MSDLMVNIDNSFFFCWHPRLEEMTHEGLHTFVDQYADTQVTDLQFCPNSQRSSVTCVSRQTAWDGYDPDSGTDQPFFAGVNDKALWPGAPNEREHMRNWVHACWLLDSRDIDPYAVWLARIRDHRIRGWISIRMNDRHYVNQPNHCIHDQFWKEHREFRRDPDFEAGNGQCLDYGRAEVRDYQLAYVREMIRRYDMDGFELDWMRNPYNFRPGGETEGSTFLSGFVKEVRNLLNKRETEVSHPIKLAVRVPAHPDTALALGFDVGDWARKGLTDTVIASSFLRHEFDVPIEIWKSMLAGTDVQLVGGIMAVLSDCTWVRPHTLETARGAAASLLDRGADGISLFNMFDNQPYGSFGEDYRKSRWAQSYRRALRELSSLDLLRPLSRRYAVTPCDTFAPGVPRVEPLPIEISSEDRAEFNLHTGAAPVAPQRTRIGIELDDGSKNPAEDLTRMSHK